MTHPPVHVLDATRMAIRPARLVVAVKRPEGGTPVDTLATDVFASCEGNPQRWADEIAGYLAAAAQLRAYGSDDAALNALDVALGLADRAHAAAYATGATR